jgi:hypothetical protein
VTLVSTAAAAAYTVASMGLNLWSEVFTTGKLEVGEKKVPGIRRRFLTALTDRYKAVLHGHRSGVRGAGVHHGVKYASTIRIGCCHRW